MENEGMTPHAEGPVLRYSRSFSSNSFRGCDCTNFRVDSGAIGPGAKMKAYYAIGQYMYAVGISKQNLTLHLRKILWDIGKMKK